jgi:hypothetical protein
LIKTAEDQPVKKDAEAWGRPEFLVDLLWGNLLLAALASGDPILQLG